MHQNERASPSRLDFFRAHYAASTQSSSRKAPIASSRGSYYPSRGTTGSRASAPIFASFPTTFLYEIYIALSVCVPNVEYLVYVAPRIRYQTICRNALSF